MIDEFGALTNFGNIVLISLFFLFVVLVFYWVIVKVISRVKKNEESARLNRIKRYISDASDEYEQLKYIVGNNGIDYLVKEFSVIDESNVDEVRKYLQSPIVVDIFSSHKKLENEKRKYEEVLNFEQEIKDNGISFHGEEFCKFYQIDLDKKRRELKNNPSLLDAMIVGKVIGGAIGGVYTAMGVVGTIMRSSETVGLTVALMKIHFYRNWKSLSGDEMAALKLLKLFQVKGVFTNDDYTKAFYSFVWNDGECDFSGVGVKSEGVFGEVQMDNWQKAGVILMSNLVSSKAIPISTTKQVISSNLNKLNQDDLVSIGLSDKYASSLFVH